MLRLTRRPRHRSGRLPDRRSRGEFHRRAGERADRRRRAISPARKFRSGTAATSSKSSRRGRLHGRFAEAARLGRGGPDSVPGARRREPRVDGLEHATPGACRCSSPKRRWSAPASKSASRATRARSWSPTEAGKVASVTADQIIVTEGRRDAGGQARRLKTDPEDGRSRLRAAQVHALERRHLHQPEDRSCKKGEQVKKGQVIADGPCTDQRRTGARPQRARRLHAVERLQLRGRHPDQREASSRKTSSPRFTSTNSRSARATPSSGRKKSRATFRTSAKKRSRTSAPTASFASARK